MKKNPKLLPSVLPFLFFLFTFCFLPSARALEVGTYDQLVKAIRETQHASRVRIEQVADQEKVRESWETGKLIDDHILLHKERADYGERVIERLADDLETSAVELRFMRQFARAYPIRWPASELSWSHYESLLSLNDTKAREEVEQQAVRHHWTRNQVREEVRKRKLSLSPPNDLVGDLKLPETKPGKIGTYQIVEREGKKYYNLGFSIYKEVKGRKIPRVNPKGEDLYTYEAQVLQVIDGDTFHARIHLGFETMVEKRVRLLRVDAPEIETSDGKEAKAYLEKLLASGKNKILIKTFGEDQHGRPLAEVFIPDVSSPKNFISVEQKMLDQGLAVQIQE